MIGKQEAPVEFTYSTPKPPITFAPYRKTITCADCPATVEATSPSMVRCKECQALANRRGQERANERLKAKRRRARAAKAQKNS